jgi:hypothetical protein
MLERSSCSNSPGRRDALAIEPTLSCRSNSHPPSFASLRHCFCGPCDRSTTDIPWLLSGYCHIRYGSMAPSPLRLGRSRQHVATETASPKCLFSRRRTEVFQAMHVSYAVSAGMRQLNDDRPWLLSGCCHTHIDPGAVTIAVSRLRHVPLSKYKSFSSAFRFAHSRAAICRVC